MAITLLDMLINAGLITREQGEEALRNRVLHGGKIGTSLIELGYVSEEQLARFLSNKLAVPYVDPEALLAIQPETIALLPRNLALKYRAIPLTLDKKRLSLVMSDPTDLQAIDEIGFITGFIIRPVAAAEVRLNQALSKYYQMDLEYRYQQIITRIEMEKLTAPAAEPVAAPAAVSPVAPQETDIFGGMLAAEEAAATEATTPPPAAEVAPSPPAAVAEPAPGAAVTAVAEPPLLELEEELEELEVLADETWTEQLRHFEPDRLSRGLAYADSSEEIANLLVETLQARLPRVALFRIKDHTATGWKGFEHQEPIVGFEELRIPLDEPSALQVVAENASFSLGPLQDTPVNRLLHDALGGGQPRPVLLMPLLVWGRLVNILYVEADGDLDELVPELQKLMTKTALAFEILIFRDKILML